MRHIMIDLETFGVRPGSVIVAIGACEIDFDTRKISNQFYRSIDLESSLKAGLVVDGSTLEWWMKQQNEVRAALFDNKVDLNVALADFASMINDDFASVAVWGCGSDFDNTLLKEAYNRSGIPVPRWWKYHSNRCFRTIRALYGSTVQEPNRQGIHHNALDDAIHQAKHLIVIVNQIGILL